MRDCRRGRDDVGVPRDHVLALYPGSGLALCVSLSVSFCVSLSATVSLCVCERTARIFNLRLTIVRMRCTNEMAACANVLESVTIIYS